MRSYREYCPIARASEIVAERWTPLLVRNLLHGCTTFAVAAGAIQVSGRPDLARRLPDWNRLATTGSNAR